MNKDIISFLQLVLGLILIGFVLIQAKGAGLGSAFGGEMGFYRTKRGFEKMLFYATIIVSTLFLSLALLGLLS